MRLTLRTLLAYLDDVLDPADKEELSQKIESSEFAEDLVHRTRDTMRRLRLSAPQVIGTGVALDPNTVSEYLDNVLPPEQVGDFERICLESDVHLAEAAACHHVLTMVLGEPADFDPRLRQRMYGVPAEARERKRVRVEAAHGPAAGVAAKPRAAAAMTAPIAHQATTRIEIPEYLRTGAWWQSRAALAGLAVVLLVGTSLYLASGLMGWFGGPPQMTELTVEQAEGPAASDARGDDSTVPPAPAKPLAPPPQLPAPGIFPPVVDSAGQSDPYAIPEATEDRYAIPGEKIEEPAPAAVPSGDVATATEDGELDRYGLPVDDQTAAIPPPAIDAPEAAALPSEPDRGVTDPAVDDRAALPPPGIGGLEVVPDADAAEEVPAGPPELGTYLGGQTVLLRYDDEAGSWFRVQPRQAVVAGQRLVALPEFRPKVSLASGVHIDMSGGTQIAIDTGDHVEAEGLPAVGPEVPAVEVVSGRIVLFNTSMADSQVRLKVGPNVADARLERSATLAVEVERQYVPGNDPRETPAPVVVRLFAPNGGVTWQEAASERTADGASRWTIEGGVTSELAAVDAPPDWIDQEPGGQSSDARFGAPVVESALVSNRPVDIQLIELFQGNPARREVKSLVTRSSIHVGLFEPFVDALRDSEQRANWNSHIEALRAAMALSPESANRVWQALASQRGERVAADLYQMLCGYNLDQIGRTPEQFKAGALARLIGWLEEDSLDYRVLAVHDLAEITGKRLMSNPAASASERKIAVRNWQRRLETDDLRPLEE